MRRGLRFSAMLGALAALCACGGAGPAGTMAWPMYQNGTTHNAIVASSLPGVSWSRDLHAKINGGLAYDGVRLFAVDFDRKLTALDPQTGRILWQSGGDDVLMSTPIVAENLVFVGSGTNAVMWDRPSGTVWGRPAGNHWYAFDAASGRLKWSLPEAGEAMPSAAYDSGRLIFATGDDVATAVLASSAAPLWKTAIPGVPMMSSAMVANGMVFLLATGGKSLNGNPDRGHTLALRAADGKVVWSAPYGVSDCTPAIAQGLVFVSGEFDGPVGPLEAYGRNDVSALDENTGALRWRYVSSPGFYSAVGSNERAITGTYDGGTLYQPIEATSQMIAFRASDGTIRWQMHTMGPVKMSPLVYRGKLYFGDTAGMFYVLDAATGTPLAAYPYGKPFTTSPPLVVGGTLFVADTDTIHAIPLSKL
ncbi:MAG TPA: PQQ-binding-like beta-propeller repeat protein [Verrucomicrobiae bacterium]|nr:PQQ-binding-like beta-propeller repeat protein [Verrucomicrobiae bacterium]